MYTTIEDFISEYQKETEFTHKLLVALTDESLKQEIAPGYRTLGHLAWHLVTSGGMLKHTGLIMELPTVKSDPPANASVIAETYLAASKVIIEGVRTQWTDEKLQEVVLMYGESWKNGLTLSIVLKHEVHHRGQLTILMRQAGLPVVGIYGPSKEEWLSMGMEAPV